MNALVNYGSSDSENEISDEEEFTVHRNFTNDSRKEEIDLEICEKTSILKLPEPAKIKVNSSIIEEDDEFLHKKAVPSVAPPKKEKVKIMIPRLSDFKDDDKEEKIKKIQPANKSGLLCRLPRPSHSFATTSKPSRPLAPASVTQTLAKPTVPQEQKKVGLIPYALMSHNPKAAAASKKTVQKDDTDDEDDDEKDVGFFTFASKDDELPEVSEDEIRALVDKESARLEQRKRQHDATESVDQFQDQQNESDEQQKVQQNLDEEAMRALMGGNRAKRSKVDNIQIVDLSAAEVMPNREEWLRKTLAGETTYMPTGNISEKVESADPSIDSSTVNYFFFNFRAHPLWQRENIKFHSCRCELKRMKLNWKRCGHLIDSQSERQKANTDFSYFFRKSFNI